MKRRKFLTGAFMTSLIAVTVHFSEIFIRHAEASGVDDVFSEKNINQILLALFETNQAIYNAAIDIQAPIEAENSKFVPFRVSAVGAERMAIVVEQNRNPLLMVVEGEAIRSGVISATINLESSSNLSCYIIRQGALFYNSKYIRLTQASFSTES